MSKKHAILYDRVSTPRQAEEGVMLEARSHSLPAYCDLKGWTVEASYTDPGRSGREGRKRPGFDAAMNHACQQGYVLVVDSLSRFVRSTIDADRALKRLHAAGADIVIVNLGIDTTTASGKLIYKVIAAVAEFESDQISERVKAAERHIYLMKGHRTSGKTAAGKMLDSNKDLVDCPEELEVIATVKEVVHTIKYGFPSAEGKWAKAARILNERGVPTIAEMRAKKKGTVPACREYWTGEKVRYFVVPQRRFAKKMKRKAAV